jgi:hypothetical protein
MMNNRLLARISWMLDCADKQDKRAAGLHSRHQGTRNRLPCPLFFLILPGFFCELPAARLHPYRHGDLEPCPFPWLPGFLNSNARRREKAPEKERTELASAGNTVKNMAFFSEGISPSTSSRVMSLAAASCPEFILVPAGGWGRR